MNRIIYLSLLLNGAVTHYNFNFHLIFPNDLLFDMLWTTKIISCEHKIRNVETQMENEF